MRRRLLALTGIVAGVVATMGAMAVARSSLHDGRPAPSAVGERLLYDVSFSFVHVASAEVAVVGLDTLCSRSVWHAVLSLTGGLPLFRVNDSTASWFDPTTFTTCRFTQKIREGRYRADRDFRIDPVRKVYTTNKGAVQQSVSDPLDDISFIYFLRSLRMTPGDVYSFQRYFQPEGNPVVIRAIRRERITVPAGTFDAILVEPHITTQGIFSQGGHAQLWFSDDSARVLLQLKSRLSFGSINLYLRQISATSTK